MTDAIGPFLKAQTLVFPLSQVVSADFSDIENLRVLVTLSNGQVIEVLDIDAIEAAMQMKPSVLESKRLRWPKFTWVVHNLLGHPLMQILALFGAYRLAFKVHDGTVPRPLGVRIPKKRDAAKD